MLLAGAFVLRDLGVVRLRRTDYVHGCDSPVGESPAAEAQVVRPQPEKKNVTVGGCGGEHRITWLWSG